MLPDPEDQLATYTVVGGLVLFAGLLFAMHAANFRFNMGIGG